MVFADIAEVRARQRPGRAHARITRAPHRVEEQGHQRVRPETKLVETTVGRALLSEILPKGLPFSNINKALKKKEISRSSTRRSASAA